MDRKTHDVKGLAVEDIDGARVGDVVDFYFDAGTDDPQWLAVEAGAMGRKVVMVPVDDIVRTEAGFRTPYPREMIMEAPQADGASIDQKTEEALYGFYHLRRQLPGRTTKRPAFKQAGDRSTTRLRSWNAWKAA